MRCQVFPRFLAAFSTPGGPLATGASKTLLGLGSAAQPVSANSSTKAAGDVVFSELVRRVGKDAAGVPHFHQVTQMKIGGSLGNPGSLLHVVGNNDDGVVLPEFTDQIFHRGSGNGVER